MKDTATHRTPPDPSRIRKMPRQFGPLDRNLVYQDHIGRLSLAEIALYVFLVCVADPRGVSYYSDRRIVEKLELDAQALREAREGLIGKGFILYEPPLYQLLDLPAPHSARGRRPRSQGGPEDIGAVLGRILNRP